jgi:hypothetical protein
MNSAITLIILVVFTTYIFAKIIIPLYRRLIKLERNGVNTVAKIIDYKTIENKGEKLYVPIVEFRDRNGQKVTVEIAQGVSKRAYNDLAGDVEVKYLDIENNHKVCYLVSQNPLRGVYLIGSFYGLGNVIFAYLLYDKESFITLFESLRELID